jgi:hypothetical protein
VEHLDEAVEEFALAGDLDGPALDRLGRAEFAGEQGLDADITLEDEVWVGQLPLVDLEHTVIDAGVHDDLAEVDLVVGSRSGFSSVAYGYLGQGDRALLADAIAFGCDAFLTVEKKLARNAHHLEKTLGLRVLRPGELWIILQPWAALYR